MIDSYSHERSSRIAGLLLIGLMAFAPTVQVHAESQSDLQAPNVVMIIVDDLSDWISLLDRQSPIKTPNLERLARRGVSFQRAYCPSPACNPSRAAILSGVRPHKSGVYGNATDWRNALPQVKTLQRCFKDAGYEVAGAGKIYHHHQDWAFHDNASFNEFLMISINEPYPEKKLNGLNWLGSRNTDWGAWPPDVRDHTDHRTMSYAVNFLSRPHDAPFFLNIGLYKPHTPFFAPQEYFDRVPLTSLAMPVLRADDWDDLPTGAAALAGPPDVISGAGRGFWNGLMKAAEEGRDAHAEVVQAYQACAMFTDAMIGKILDSIERSPGANNTLIVLWSDHGFHLGEKKNIEKFMLWEKTTHVPFIIAGDAVASPGRVVESPVDLMAIYPTLLDLAGLPPMEHCDGRSLVPLLLDSVTPESEVINEPALMTYLRRNHAVRSRDWRYIRYADGTEELYDHRSDPHEWTNLAFDDQYETILGEHRQWIPQQDAPPFADRIQPH